MTNLSVVSAAVPIGSIESYCHYVEQLPMLSLEEEQALAHAFQEKSDLNAAQKLVLYHLRYVVRIARGYQGYGLPLSDLIQEGALGLMKAVKRFEPMKGARLATFSIQWIKSEIHEFVIRNWRIVKVATTKAHRKLFFNLRKHKKQLRWLTSDEINQVAKDLNVKPTEVREMEMRLSAQDAPLLGFDDQEEGCKNPVISLPAPRSDPAMHFEHQEDAVILDQMVDGLETLDPREKYIIQNRWLTEDKQSLKVLAEELKLSIERVRQIEKLAMKKLKAILPAKDLVF